MTGQLVAADFGDEQASWENSKGQPLFRKVIINWSEPQKLSHAEKVRLQNGEDVNAFQSKSFLYAITRRHGNQKGGLKVAYIGITADLYGRFKNHPTVDYLRKKRGETCISIGEVLPQQWSPRAKAAKQLREELEHILIWTLWHDLENEKKTWTVPGQGRNNGRAWRIENEGYEFDGLMPKRILFPWAAIERR